MTSTGLIIHGDRFNSLKHNSSSESQRLLLSTENRRHPCDAAELTRDGCDIQGAASVRQLGCLSLPFEVPTLPGGSLCLHPSSSLSAPIMARTPLARTPLTGTLPTSTVGQVLHLHPIIPELMFMTGALLETNLVAKRGLSWFFYIHPLIK